MTIKSRQQLATLMSMSDTEALRAAASNTEVMRCIFHFMDPQIDYQKVVSEFNDPRFKQWAERYHRGMHAHATRHPGRSWVRVLYPRHTGMNSMPQDPSVDVYGLQWRSRDRHRYFDNGTAADYLLEGRFTHEDLDRVLTELGVKRFKSKPKAEKITMLMKTNP